MIKDISVSLFALAKYKLKGNSQLFLLDLTLFCVFV